MEGDMIQGGTPITNSYVSPVKEDRLARLEDQVAAIASAVHELLSRKEAGSPGLTESFTDGRLAPQYRGQARESTSPQKKERRSSLMLKDVLPKTHSTPDTVSTLTTVATPKVFKSNTLQRGPITFLLLQTLQSELSVHYTDPGALGQHILLWNDHFMGHLTRQQTYRKLEQFTHRQQDNTLLQKRFEDWYLPKESELATWSHNELLALLEVSIIPTSPKDYELALTEICESVVEMKKTSLTPAATPYYLGNILRAIDLVRAYDKLVPETHGGQRMPYNLGVKKNHGHGTKGTISVVNDALMPTELQHAVANGSNQTLTPSSLMEYLDQLETVIKELSKTYDSLKHWLTACQTLESKRKRDVVTTHRTSKVEETTEDLFTTNSNTDHPLTQATTTTRETHEVAAIDATDLKKTPCYAFIQGNCTSGRECARSHDKKELEQFLQEQLTTVRKM